MYDFKKTEEEILEFWKKNKIHDKLKKQNSGGKKFYFLQGPPYTSGRLHIGHAWNNTLKDLVLRYKWMNGFNVWDRAGYDMHGLPTENAVQKNLGIKDKLEIEKYGVEKFVRECIKFSSENAKLMDKDLERLGVWMDFENAYWPINENFIEGEWWLIKKAWEQKRLYKGKKIMQWCASCETSLAKHELDYEGLEEDSIFLKLKLKGKKDEYLIIWTTTPWTIPFNLAVMVNPEIDYVKAEVEISKGKKEKWIVARALVNVFIQGLLELNFKVVESFKGSEIEGFEYIHPFQIEMKKIFEEMKKQNSKLHTVILSEEYVDTSAGSGLVHCAPGCGPEDYEVGKKYGLGAFNFIDEKGTFPGEVKEFAGLVAKKDDKKFIDMLEKNGSLIKTTKVEHEYAHCWRCHNPVVFRATEQWFMKIEDLVQDMLKFNKEVKWEPKSASKNYDRWIESLKDNGITRQRYWGCPVPIWECEKCGNIEVVESRKELERKGAKKIPKDLHKPWIDLTIFSCPKCKNEMRRIPDVIDVWIDSGTTSWNCLYYPSTKKYFNLWPADFILEATEQIRLWFSMLQICSAIAFKKSCYKNVYCHGMILDYQGMKMSKSLGNIISPYEIVDKYGADILRYYMCQATAGENINFNWEEVKIKQKNIDILLNISKFLKDISKSAKIQQQKNLDIEEKYILSRKNKTVKEVSELMEEYRIDEIIKKIEDLFLDLSRVYIKLTRDKVNSSDAGKVFYATKEVLIDVLKMFSIVSPFITEKIWQNIKELNLVREESVHLSPWPKYDKKLISEKLEKEFGEILKILERGFSERDKIQIGLKWPLAKTEIFYPGKISKEFHKIILEQFNVKKVKIKKSEKEVRVVFDTTITSELEAEGYSREIARKVQDSRKKSGFEKKDIIKLGIVMPTELKELLAKYPATLKFLIERTNAKDLVMGQLNSKDFLESDYENKFHDKIKNKEITILFSKI